jgi:hypothetical protein
MDRALLEAAIRETLQLDIRSTHQGRGKAEAATQVPFEVHIDCLRVRFTTQQGAITVVDVVEEDVRTRRYRQK